MSRKKGQAFEGVALDYLEGKGYRILERNYLTKYGEIDLIAISEDTLVFIEVKYRSTADYGLGFEAVRLQKLRKLERAMWHYIHQHACHLPHNFRLDVVSIDGKVNSEVAYEITHYENVPLPGL